MFSSQPPPPRIRGDEETIWDSRIGAGIRLFWVLQHFSRTNQYTNALQKLISRIPRLFHLWDGRLITHARTINLFALGIGILLPRGIPERPMRVTVITQTNYMELEDSIYFRVPHFHFALSAYKHSDICIYIQLHTASTKQPPLKQLRIFPLVLFVHSYAHSWFLWVCCVTRWHAQKEHSWRDYSALYVRLMVECLTTTLFHSEVDK